MTALANNPISHISRPLYNQSFLTGRKGSLTGRLFGSLCPSRQFATFANCFAMSPILHGRARTVQRDAFFASLCPLRQFANFFPLLFLRAHRDFIAGHFYESRLTRVSNGTLFSRPCVPCVNLLIVLQCRQLFLKGRKD